MSKEFRPPPEDEMLEEYDFSQGVRGKYAKRYAAGTQVVMLTPEVSETALENRASWKGKALELLIAATFMLRSDGKLNISTPLVDDDGVDLVLSLRGRPAALAVQVKARFRPGAFPRNTFQTQVRRSTFRARPELALLFVLYDNVAHRLETAWLVPSLAFQELTQGQSHADRLVFAASLTGMHNAWAKFRYTLADLPAAAVALLEGLND